MSAVAGTDRTYWHDRIGLFGPSSPLANEAGIEALSGPRDYDKVKRDLKAAGYRGEPIVVLAVSGTSYIAPISAGGGGPVAQGGHERRSANDGYRNADPPPHEQGADPTRAGGMSFHHPRRAVQ